MAPPLNPPPPNPYHHPSTSSSSSTSLPHTYYQPQGYSEAPISFQTSQEEDSFRKRKAEEEPKESMVNQSEGQPRRASSTRIVACSECKRLKIKCDRVFPCSNCRKRGLATICPDGELKGGKGRRLILASTADLHARISKLEAALQQSYSKETGSNVTHPLLESSHHFEPLSDDEPSSASRPRPAPAPSTSLPSQPHSPNRDQPRQLQEDEEVSDDVADNFGTLTLGEESGVSRFHVNSASAYLLAEDSPSPNASQPPDPSIDFAPPIDFHTTLVIDATDPLAAGSPSSSSGRSVMESLISNLPSREKAWSICEAYFQNGAWTYDSISRTRFYEDYFSIVFPSDRPQDVSPPPQRLALVLCVLSLGCLFDLNSPPQSKTSKSYFSMAKSALSLDSTASLTFIRSIMLMSNYVMHHADRFSSSGETSWSLLGLAARTAQALGLHRDGSNWPGLSVAEAEERRQVFWELHAYETLQSINLGRPRATQTSSIDAKFPQQTGERTNLYPAYKYRFMELMAQVNDLQTCTKSRSYENCLAIDRSIRLFEKNLPPETHISTNGMLIKADDEDPEARSFFLQKQTMRLVINMGQLFLHRPWFARALKDHPDEPLRSKYSQSYVALLEASKSLVAVLRDVLTLHIALVSRFWFFFFHGFSAAVNLSAAVIRAPSSSLAAAALSEVELATSLFEVVAQVGSRAREELPHLRRLRDRAREQLAAAAQPRPFFSAGPSTSSNVPASGGEDDSLLGTETSLRRPQRVDTSPSFLPSFSATSSAPPPPPQPNPFGPESFYTPYMSLPTTFEDATAARPMNPPPSTFGDFTTWNAGPGPNVWGFEGVQVEGAGDGSGSSGSASAGSNVDDPLHVDFDYSSFLAGLGIVPRG